MRSRRSSSLWRSTVVRLLRRASLPLVLVCKYMRLPAGKRSKRKKGLFVRGRRPPSCQRYIAQKKNDTRMRRKAGRRKYISEICQASHTYYLRTDFFNKKYYTIIFCPKAPSPSILGGGSCARTIRHPPWGQWLRRRR